jgi:hypothetical protein
MFICNKCGYVFHFADTVKEPLDDDFNGQRSFIGYQVCPECRSSDIEEANTCDCGAIKKKADEYCDYCIEMAGKITQCAITDIKEFIPQLTRPQARELLRYYVEENL